VDHEHELVDEVASHQRLDQLPAAQHPEVLARLLLELSNRLGGVAVEERRVAPRQRFLQRRRRDVLLGLVEHLGVRIVRLVGPEREEVFVGPSPEEQRAALRHPLAHLPPHDLVGAGVRPAAVLEPAAVVLVGTARGLHHPVERHVFDHDDFAHPQRRCRGGAVFSSRRSRVRRIHQ
jgi:hypothetical protein